MSDERRDTVEAGTCEWCGKLLMDSAIHAEVCPERGQLLSEIDRLAQRNKELRHDLELAHMTVGNLGDRVEELGGALDKAVQEVRHSMHLAEADGKDEIATGLGAAKDIVSAIRRRALESEGGES